MTIEYSAHELATSHDCAHPACEDEAEVLVAGWHYCSLHADAAYRAAVATIERAKPRLGADGRPVCTHADCAEPGVYRVGQGGRGRYCERHNQEKRRRISESMRRRYPERDLDSAQQVASARELAGLSFPVCAHRDEYRHPDCTEPGIYVIGTGRHCERHHRERVERITAAARDARGRELVGVE